MWSMHAPSSPTSTRSAEPGPFLLVFIFMFSLIATGLIGAWLWNSNASAHNGKSLGTPNQVGPLVAAAPVGGGAAAAGVDPALATKGQALAQQLGCVACHSATGQAGVGPTWKGLAGSNRDLDGGASVVADDAYLKESIQQPDAKIVKGFPKGVMSGAVAAAEDQISQGDNLDALIAYIKTLK
jgi:cytochrome c2